VCGVAHDEIHPLFGVVDAIEMSHAIDRPVDSLDWEVLIRRCRTDTDRSWRHRRHEVVVVDSLGDTAGYRLLGVSPPARFQLFVSFRNGTTGCSDVDPLVDEGEIQRLRTTAGGARNADSVIIDVVSSEEVIERTPVVVDHVSDEVRPSVETLLARITMGKRSTAPTDDCPV
jgi:hypothetical protein